jgi:hypothetical protein
MVGNKLAKIGLFTGGMAQIHAKVDQDIYPYNTFEQKFCT